MQSDLLKFSFNVGCVFLSKFSINMGCVNKVKHPLIYNTNHDVMQTTSQEQECASLRVFAMG